MVHSKKFSIDVYFKDEGCVLASFYFSPEDKFSRLLACNRAGFFVESFVRFCSYDVSRFRLIDTYDKFSWSLKC